MPEHTMPHTSLPNIPCRTPVGLLRTERCRSKSKVAEIRPQCIGRGLPISPLELAWIVLDRIGRCPPPGELLRYQSLLKKTTGVRHGMSGMSGGLAVLVDELGVLAEFDLDFVRLRGYEARQGRR